MKNFYFVILFIIILSFINLNIVNASEKECKPNYHPFKGIWIQESTLKNFMDAVSNNSQSGYINNEVCNTIVVYGSSLVPPKGNQWLIKVDRLIIENNGKVKDGFGLEEVNYNNAKITSNGVFSENAHDSQKKMKWATVDCSGRKLQISPNSADYELVSPKTANFIKEIAKKCLEYKKVKYPHGVSTDNQDNRKIVK